MLIFYDLYTPQESKIPVVVSDSLQGYFLHELYDLKAIYRVKKYVIVLDTDDMTLEVIEIQKLLDYFGLVNDCFRVGFDFKGNRVSFNDDVYIKYLRMPYKRGIYSRYLCPFFRKYLAIFGGKPYCSTQFFEMVFIVYNNEIYLSVYRDPYTTSRVSFGSGIKSEYIFHLRSGYLETYSMNKVPSIFKHLDDLGYEDFRSYYEKYSWSNDDVKFILQFIKNSDLKKQIMLGGV